MQLDIVTPERQLLSADVTQVQIPGMEGDITILGPHAPVVTTLRPGFLKVTSSDGTTDYVVTGGFAEISGESTSVLAEEAVLKADASAEMLDAAIETAQSALDVADSAGKAAIAQRINDLTDLKSRLG